MPRQLKAYQTAEFRDSVVSYLVGDLIGAGRHRQATYWVAAYTKLDALARLNELRFPVRIGHLRAHKTIETRVGGLLTVAGDVVAWKGGGGAPVVRIVAHTTEPLVVAHWRADPDADPHRPWATRPVLRTISEEEE